MCHVERKVENFISFHSRIFRKQEVCGNQQKKTNKEQDAVENQSAPFMFEVISRTTAAVSGSVLMRSSMRRMEERTVE